MVKQTLKKHSDFASKAEFIELPETDYDYINDIRYDLQSHDLKIIAGTSTNTIQSYKTVGWDGDSDND
jgi:hypothetical protein